VNLVVTSVPGSPVPLYAGGARLLDAIPIVPIAGNLSVGVAALSYERRLVVGITADRDRCPDVEVMARGMKKAFTTLTAVPKRVKTSAA
jgi:diacylglycerol O-acyltransferase / wax synthase